MTIKFYNNNERFGDCGPFEAESKEVVVDAHFSELLDTWTAEYGDEHDLDDEDRNEYRSNLAMELVSGLVAEYHGEPRLIFDNGGNITLQLPEFAHTYDDAEQCAEDIRAWIENEDTTGWDGNEEEAVFEPTMDEISNGGYQIETLSDFLAGREEVHGGNAEQLREALGLIMPDTLDGLLEALKNNHPCVLDHHGQWSSDLPTFGGEEIRATEEAWSWDATRKIIGTCCEDLEIVNR